MGLRDLFKSMHVHDWQWAGKHIEDKDSDIDEQYEVCLKCGAKRNHRLNIEHADGSHTLVGCTYDEYKLYKEISKHDESVDKTKVSSDKSIMAGHVIGKGEVLIRLDNTNKLPLVYVDRERAVIVSCEFKYVTSTFDGPGKQYYLVSCYLKSDDQPTLHKIKVDVVTGKTYFN
ncbi:hypothetical protein [Paucilactobacillus kaifaensis]|uniref:hypothetical protein n=1 Tax=Paucilactobacillus kaifaensis TaxID=2559921 RepID=UPI0010F9AEA5|nr:hypothetical protein [Paucilactobacillus kaifaensis]